MGYEVLARKWRPQQFEDVVGQDHVTHTLKNAITQNRIAHAYLFVGPRGIGKTSLARIFAKSLNCVEGPTVTPCGVCDSCREITSGNSLDVLEIDGASNNGVEQVRELRDTIRYAPTRGPYKIYVIDEVHMLSASAFNALLKTLEEPPAHVKFIFATTEPEKILATILSRCQRFDLKRIPVNLITERLAKIAEAEDVTASADALLAVARAADGGMRDAQSALDQLISFCGETIEEEDVLSVFGMISRAVLEGLAGQILDGDIRTVLETIAGLDESGKDFQRMVMELLLHFRDVLVYVHTGEDAATLDLREGQAAVLAAQAAKTDAACLLRVIEILGQTESRLRFALSRRTVVETGLIRCARAATTVTLEELLERIVHLEQQGKPATAPATATVREASANFVVQSRVEPAKRAPAEEQAESELNRLCASWKDIVNEVSRLAILARAPLLDARPVTVDGAKVVVALDPEFADEASRFTSAREKQAVDLVLGRYLKRSVKTEFIVADHSLVPPGAPPNCGNRSFEASPPPAQDVRPQPTARSLSSRADWYQEPAVRMVLERFDGRIIDVRE